MPRGWNEMRWPQEGEWTREVETGFDPQVLREIGERSVQVPSDLVRTLKFFSDIDKLPELT